MKFFILASLALLAGAQEPEIYNFFRMKNGTIVKGKTEYKGVTGTLWVLPFMMGIFGLEASTVTPFSIVGVLTDANSAPSDGFERDYSCEGLIWERREIETDGSIRLNGPSDAVKLAVKCNLKDGEGISIKATVYEIDEPKYSAREAGLRARLLIGQSIEKFRAHEVITYAGMDRGYLKDDKNCWTELAGSRRVSIPAPGIAILGKDGKHCAILDHEGTKFIHSNPVKKVVTEDSTVMLGRYFPNGYHYVEYAPVISASALLQS